MNTSTTSPVTVTGPGRAPTLRHVVGKSWRGATAAAWSVTRSLRLLGRVHAALAAALLVGLHEHVVAWMVGSASAGVLLLVWPGAHTRSWTVVVERWHIRRWYRRNWNLVCGRVGLSVHRSTADQHFGRRRRRFGRLLPSLTTASPKGSAGRVVPASVTVVPRLVSVRLSGPLVVLRVRLVAGLTLLDVERAAPRLAVALNVPRVLVDPDGHNGARLSLTASDLLADPFAATLPDPETDTQSAAARAGRLVVPASVVVGRVEDGTDWQVSLGPSTLVAGAAGAGKGSVLWGVVLGLGPWVHSGLVRLHGIDLKGGMELLLGRDLFTTMATTPDDAVALLEDLAGQCVTRTHLLAGHVRTHIPTLTEPLHLLVVDELAAVTAYLGDRQLRDRADRALSLLLSQGRAPKFVVWAFLQDPRKDVVPQRGLFQVTIGLRLRDTSEVAMIFGDGALVDLAPCHRITRQTPGTGYVLPEGGGNPVRVRAGYTDDDTIRRAARLYAAPPPTTGNAQPHPTSTVGESAPHTGGWSTAPTVTLPCPADPPGPYDARHEDRADGPGSGRARTPRKPRPTRPARASRAEAAVGVDLDGPGEGITTGDPHRAAVVTSVEGPPLRRWRDADQPRPRQPPGLRGTDRGRPRGRPAPERPGPWGVARDRSLSRRGRRVVVRSPL